MSRRGTKTRAALVAAARTIFERDGFLDSRVQDIATEAGVSNGSFYTYFVDKNAVFLALMEEVQEEMLHPQPPADEQDLLDRGLAHTLEHSNRAYLESYRDNAALMRVLEQVSAINDEFREHRQARSKAFVGRNARLIRQLQKEGIADSALDPEITAWALSGMVSRLAFHAFVLGEPMRFEQLVSTTTRLWLNALLVPTVNHVQGVDDLATPGPEAEQDS